MIIVFTIFYVLANLFEPCIPLKNISLFHTFSPISLRDLDDRGSRVRFLAGIGNFSLHHGSGAHPASYPVGTRSPLRGGKAAGAWS
jgi:hypothetical protein